MHAAATTDLPVDDLATARRAIESVTAELSARARDRVLRIPFDLPAQVRAAGPEAEWNTYALNPFGIPVRVTFDDETSRGSFVPGALHEGPPDSLHGGWSAHLMDCMLGGLVQATGARAVTATLELSYRHRVPLDSEVSMEATITRRDGRKIFAEGWIEHDGVRCVEATALFIRVDGISVDGVAS
nr:PaaI family thioesterase [Nocardioides daedukensis]